jgi:hypothetical protein
VSPVKYKLGFYISEDDILHSHRRNTLESYTDLPCPQSQKSHRVLFPLDSVSSAAEILLSLCERFVSGQNDLHVSVRFGITGV